MTTVNDVLAAPYHTLSRVVADGLVVSVMQLTYGRGRIGRGPDMLCFDDAW